MDSEAFKRLEDDLWTSADTLRANTDLKSSEYSTPVLGLIFLKFADNKYRLFEEEIQAEFDKLKGGRREKPIEKIAIAKCGFYLPEHARYDYLLTLPEEADIAKAIKDAMIAIESYQEDLKQGDVLPKDEYDRLVRTDKSIPKRLLQNFANIPVDADGDLFGKIYEYFLGNFALAEGQGGGEFFTPQSVVRLMVEIIEPYRGKVLDPACGSGGMFVQSGKFIAEHRKALEQEGIEASVSDLFVCGQEKTGETVKLAKMNMVVNGLRGQVKQANSYYDDLFNSFEEFDYVLANPPFNVDDVNLDRVKEDRRFNTFGVPQKKTKAKKKDQGNETVPNANYLWINLFATSLKANGRAGLVMANSASDARHSEADIRQRLIQENLISGMVTLPSNMFYTVTLPATLWFFDKGKTDEQILFIDSRNVFTQVDRAHREFSAEQVNNLAMISHLRRGKRNRFIALVDRYFEQGMDTLRESRKHVEPLSDQLMEVLAEDQGKAVTTKFAAQWEDLAQLESKVAFYWKSHETNDAIEVRNEAQQQLRTTFDPFLEALHGALKQLDQVVRKHEKALALEKKGKRSVNQELKALKGALEALHQEVRNAEVFFSHIAWLQERFPMAAYEDVTGLCKLASLEEVKEQDWSLNPGRYVGVVIEEDGKTEEEFLVEMMELNQELLKLNQEAHGLESAIAHNIEQLLGEAD